MAEQTSDFDVARDGAIVPDSCTASTSRRSVITAAGVAGAAAFAAPAVSAGGLVPLVGTAATGSGCASRFGEWIEVDCTPAPSILVNDELFVDVPLTVSQVSSTGNATIDGELLAALSDAQLFLFGNRTRPNAVSYCAGTEALAAVEAQLEFSGILGSTGPLAVDALVDAQNSLGAFALTLITQRPSVLGTYTADGVVSVIDEDDVSLVADIAGEIGESGSPVPLGGKCAIELCPGDTCDDCVDRPVVDSVTGEVSSIEVLDVTITVQFDLLYQQSSPGVPTNVSATFEFDVFTSTMTGTPLFGAGAYSVDYAGVIECVEP